MYILCIVVVPLVFITMLQTIIVIYLLHLTKIKQFERERQLLLITNKVNYTFASFNSLNRKSS